MKIAVDARELTGRPTGVGRYLIELLNHWDTPQAQRHSWRLYTHAPVSVGSAFNATVEILPGNGGTAWEQWTLVRALARDRPDVLFAPGYTAPFTAPCPTALTIHDVSFAAHPEWFSWREGTRRRLLTTWSARRARVVVTDSQFSRDEIVRHLGVARERVRVVSLGSPAAVSPPSGPREAIVLYVGSIFRRRHVDRLIEAFVRGVAPAVQDSRLEIIGDNRLFPPGDPREVLSDCPREIADRVSLRAYVDEATLRGLYERAAVFAFLSEYEGFGLTPLEALAAGVPPVVVDTPIAREIYGSAARFVSDAANVGEIGDALVEMLTQPSARASVLGHAASVLGRYDWRQTANLTLQAIEEAAGV